jgi:hypothetical protein
MTNKQRKYPRGTVTPIRFWNPTGTRLRCIRAYAPEQAGRLMFGGVTEELGKPTWGQVFGNKVKVVK